MSPLSADFTIIFNVLTNKIDTMASILPEQQIVVSMCSFRDEMRKELKMKNEANDWHH